MNGQLPTLFAPLGLERVEAREFGSIVLPRRQADALLEEWRSVDDSRAHAAIWDKYLPYDIPVSQVVDIADAIAMLRSRGILEEDRVQLVV